MCLRRKGQEQSQTGGGCRGGLLNVIFCAESNEEGSGLTLDLNGLSWGPVWRRSSRDAKYQPLRDPAGGCEREESQSSAVAGRVVSATLLNGPQIGTESNVGMVASS